MKNLRILGVVLGTALLSVMFSCGGSSFLTEAPLELWDSDSVAVRFHAVGLEAQPTTSNQTGLAKDFFVSDAFSGDGVITGDNLSESIQVDCLFDAPVISAIDGGTAAVISVVEDDPALCADIRNCCVYTIDADWADPCSLDVECILDETLANLDNTQIDLGFDLRQHMTTSMRSDSGLITTSIVEEAETAGAIPIDTSIFTISSATINRDACTGLPGSGTFLLNDDNYWLDIEGQNGPDLLHHADLLWNVDTIADVDIVGGVGNTSECYLYYENIPGQVSLAPVASSTSVEEYVLIDGEGKICNSRSYTDCGGAPSFDLTLDMFDPAVAGDDLTFAQAGVHHICGTTEGDDCHPTAGAGNSGCLSYLINNVEPALDGCLSLCFDYTGIGPPSVGGSPMADYILNLGLDADQPTCEANGGTWQEVDPAVFMCLPIQMLACNPPEPEEYGRGDAYVAGVDEPAEAAMATIFSHGSDADNAGAADFVWNSDKTMYQYMIDCANASKGYALAAVPYERNTNQMNSDSSVDDTCANVAQRFVSTTVNPGDLGTNKVLTPYNLSVVFENFGSTTTQGLVVRILDGAASAGGEDAPVFEDISGSYIQGDDTPIPAARRLTYDVVTQWFNANDQRVSLQVNPLLPVGLGEGDWMSVYTDDGSTKGGESWIKVSTHLDFHRINEANLFEPTPENVYLLMIDLMAPISAAGGNAGMGCDFSQQFVIDGTCACDVDPDACP